MRKKRGGGCRKHPRIVLMIRGLKEDQMGWIYFWGGLWANSTPFAMLPFRSLMATSSSSCSLGVTFPRMLMAFSAPLGCNCSQ